MAWCLRQRRRVSEVAVLALAGLAFGTDIGPFQRHDSPCLGIDHRGAFGIVIMKIFLDHIIGVCLPSRRRHLRYTMATTLITDRFPETSSLSSHSSLHRSQLLKIVQLCAPHNSLARKTAASIEAATAAAEGATSLGAPLRPCSAW